MEINKFKAILVAICCVVTALWTEVQGMEERRDEPTGSIISFAGEVVPNGWLLCDGQQYSNQKYPELYEVVRDKYVPGESWVIEANRHSQLEKYFCVPDLRGRVIVGIDSGAGRVTANNILGATDGTENVILTIDQMPKHKHGTSYGGNVIGNNAVGSFANASGGAFNHNNCIMEYSGGDQPHNNMQPYMCLNYIINTGQSNEYQQNEMLQLRQKINQLEISQQGCAKAWVVFNGSNPDTLNSYGVSSVVRNSVGNYTINFLIPFSSSDYCSSLSPTKADCALLASTADQTQQSFVFNTFKILGWVSADPVRVSACFFGNQ